MVSDIPYFMILRRIVLQSFTPSIDERAALLWIMASTNKAAKAEQ
jgi:hypothetical protein